MMMTADEVAAMLGVRADTVRRWLRSGLMRAARTPAGWRITQADLDAFMAAHRDRFSTMVPAAPACTEPAAITGPIELWLMCDGWRGPDHALVTLRTVPRDTLACEIAVWLRRDWCPVDTATVLAALDAIENRLSAEMEEQS